jgi:hypothetical protein
MATATLRVSEAQMDVLRRYPRHQGILESLGISLPAEAIVLVEKTGIRIVVPHRPLQQLDLKVV